MTFCLLLMALSATTPAPVPESVPDSVPEEEEVRQVARQACNTPDFGKEKVELVWRPKVPTDADQVWRLGGALAQFVGTVVAWVVAIAGVALILLLVVVVARARSKEAREAEEAKSSPPETLFGLDLRPEALPHDLLGAAAAAWSSGNHGLALSTLYRGALAWVVGRGTEVPSSATECECIALVEGRFGNEVGVAFGALTNAWLQTAYGRQPPSREVFIGLLEHWRPYLGGRR